MTFNVGRQYTPRTRNRNSFYSAIRISHTYFYNMLHLGSWNGEKKYTYIYYIYYIGKEIHTHTETHTHAHTHAYTHTT